MIKKSCIAMFSLIFIFWFDYSSASAMENSSLNVEDDNSIAVFTEERDWAIEEEFIDEISPFVIVDISHSKLGIKKYVKSKNAFNFQKGDKIKIKSVTWNPSGQKIQLGFINATNGNQYWTGNYTGGSKTGGTFSLGGPSGKYYIAIRTPSTNSKSINVKGKFEF